MAGPIGISEPGNPSLAESRRFARQAEAAGFGGLGFRDHQGDGRDVFLRMAAASAETSRITLYPAVTNPVTRHPTVLAALAQTLNEAAPGRTKLFLGAGDTATSSVGQRPATVAEMRAAVTTIRALLAGRAVPFDHGGQFRLAHVSEPPPPVGINASSPQMVRLAGEVADEAFLMVGVHPRILGRAHRLLLEGAARGGRQERIPPITLGVPVYLGTTTDAALERARTGLAFWLRRQQRVFSQEVAALGMGIGAVSGPQDIPPSLVPRLCKLMGVVGDAKTCARQIIDLVTTVPVAAWHFLVYGIEDPEVVLRLFHDEVFPALG